MLKKLFQISPWYFQRLSNHIKRAPAKGSPRCHGSLVDEINPLIEVADKSIMKGNAVYPSSTN